MSDRCPACYRKYTKQTAVLVAILEHGPVSVQQLEAILDLEAERVYQEVARLIREGMVEHAGTVRHTGRPVKQYYATAKVRTYTRQTQAS